MTNLGKYRKSIVILLVLLFSIVVLNASLNKHNHLISGYLYTHAHPFQKSTPELPLNPHSHTKLELIVLDIVSDFEVLLVLYASLAVYLVVREIFWNINISLAFQRQLFGNIIPRAPPL